MSILKFRAPQKAIAASAAAALAASVLIAPWEGFSVKAYRDIVGIWTICYGETQGVKPGMVKTKAECDAIFAKRVGEFEHELDRCLKRATPTKTKAALISWIYNVGADAACKSTLVRKANAGDLTGACNELPKWNIAGGKVSRGLVNRRAAEQKLCLEGLRG